MTILLPPIGLFSFLYNLGKDGVNYVRLRRRLTNSQRVERRQKWKPLFEAKIWETHCQKLRRDVIIRDIKRLDDYPSSVDSKRS